MPRTILPVAIATGALLFLAGCSAPAPVPSSRPAPSYSPSHSALVVGTTFPVTGTASFLGGAQAAGVATAVADINAAGGVLGNPVTVVNEDSGDVTTTTMEASLADLKKKGADVIIGPSSSALVQRVFPTVLADRIPMISPSATSVALTALGRSGYFFRTVPSEADQGRVLAQVIGKKKVALIYLDDDTGQAIRASLTAGLAAGGGKLVADQSFSTTTTDFSAVLAAVQKAAPDDVVFVSNFGTMDQNKTVITGLDTAGLGGAKLWLTSENMADYSQALPAGALANVNGMLEGVSAGDAFNAKIHATDANVTNYLYAAESYDATVLAALAAAVGGDTSGRGIADHLRSVSEGGIKCTSYAECIQALATHQDIDYDGLSGAIAFDATGNPNPAHYGLYRYDGQNRFALVGSAVG